MDFKLDIKTLITILTVVITISGFYYTTQARLNNLEEKVEIHTKEIQQLKKKIRINKHNYKKDK